MGNKERRRHRKCFNNCLFWDDDSFINEGGLSMIIPKDRSRYKEKTNWFKAAVVLFIMIQKRSSFWSTKEGGSCGGGRSLSTFGFLLSLQTKPSWSCCTGGLLAYPHEFKA